MESFIPSHSHSPNCNIEFPMARDYASFYCLYSTNEQRMMAASRLENVTQTIARILEGYDIRLRPNFGGKNMYLDNCHVNHKE
jgi:hypothetical protein